MKEIILDEIQKSGSAGVNLATLVLKVNEKSKTRKTEKQVSNYINSLRSEGYNINEDYDTNGNIIYTLNYIFQNDENNSVIMINPVDSKVRALFVSDIHIGRKYEDGLENLNKVMEYASQNDIHIIFSLGDLFEGVHSNDPDFTFPNQLERFNKLYPCKAKILHFTLLGNHDLTIFHRCGFDIGRKIGLRHDIINLGYGVGKIRLGQELIGFKHDLIFEKAPSNLEGIKIIFKGHSHKFEFLGSNFKVPALLGEQFTEDLLSTGFLDVEFDLNEKQLVENLKIKHFIFLPEPVKVNDINIPIIAKKKTL